jgi:hypothetical protein
MAITILGAQLSSMNTREPTPLPLGGTEAYGTYHKESFVCPFCGSRQVVQLQG